MAVKGTISLVLGEGNKEDDIPGSFEMDEEALGLEPCLSELDELMMTEEYIVAIVTRESL